VLFLLSIVLLRIKGGHTLQYLMEMLSPYFFVKYTWFTHVDVNKLASELGSSFEVTTLKRTDPGPMSIVGRTYVELFLVKGDTLNVFLAPVRATLFQKERKPFTQKDLELRNIISVHYPHTTSTPLPFGISKEPSFEVEDKP
jgi:hypothetical protein